MDDVVRVERAAPRHEERFLRAALASRRALRPWVAPPLTAKAFHAYLRKGRSPRNRGYVIIDRAEKALVGVVNVSEIVRGSFESAYLGYYVFRPFEGRGLMSAGLGLVIDEAFCRLGLHRLEANIQPENVRSRSLAARLGFELEGLSPRYLRIGGRWRDHERWALRAEQ